MISASGGNELRGRGEAMLKRMMHAPDYRSGIHVDEKLGLWGGWVARAGSFADAMPVWNEKRDVCLIFSGEDFTEAGVLEKLAGQGHRFEANNASYLVHLYEEKGLDFLQELNGWFGGILIDRRESKIILFNDRYGLSRIHYHESENGFYFASEAKALLTALPELRELDLRGLGELFSCGCVLQNRTLFRGINLLPPASAWVFAAGKPIQKTSYFDVQTWEQQPALGAGDYYEQLKATWSRLLPRYLRGPESAALSLTGGVDSRMILAWVRQTERSLPCFTFGGRYRDCADVAISREVAARCGQPHHVIPIGGDFLSKFPDLAAQTVNISDGTMDVTGAIDLYVQQKARELAPARVTGTNGGEILRSLVAFKPMRICEELFAAEFRQHTAAAAQTYATELGGRRLSFTAFKQAPWYMCSKFVVERSAVTLRMPYFDNDLVKLVYQAPAEMRDDNELSLRLIADGNPRLRPIGTDRGVSLNGTPVLREARHMFQEFTFKAEYAYDYGMPQWLAKLDHVFDGLKIERLFLGRHKFHHFRVFYRDELSDYVREMLLDSKTLNRPFLNRVNLERMVKAHLDGTGNYTLEIHKALTSELLMRQLIEQS